MMTIRVLATIALELIREGVPIPNLGKKKINLLKKITQGIAPNISKTIKQLKEYFLLYSGQIRKQIDEQIHIETSQISPQKKLRR